MCDVLSALIERHIIVGLNVWISPPRFATLRAGSCDRQSALIIISGREASVGKDGTDGHGIRSTKRSSFAQMSGWCVEQKFMSFIISSVKRRRFKPIAPAAWQCWQRQAGSRQ